MGLFSLTEILLLGYSWFLPMTSASGFFLYFPIPSLYFLLWQCLIIVKSLLSIQSYQCISSCLCYALKPKFLGVLLGFSSLFHHSKPISHQLAYFFSIHLNYILLCAFCHNLIMSNSIRCLGLVSETDILPQPFDNSIK